MALKKYFIKNRLWIEGENGTFLAEGRIQLLKVIAEAGSINQAAKSMKMSYKKAWELIDGMNKEAKKPLVLKISGGKKGGGTEVTAYGKSMISLFDKLNSKCQSYLDKELTKLNF